MSAYQGDIDWQILSNQEIDFAYIKATEGSSFVDGKFNYNWSEASKTKLRVGAYHFFSFESLGETQAENYIGAVGEIENMLPPVVDVEPYGNFNSIEQRNIDELKVWLNLVEEHYGVRPIIYTTEKYYSFLSDNLDEYEFWLRSVYSVPRKDKDWCIWQYSNRKRLKGYNGKEKYIDMNAFYGTNEEFALFGRKKVNEKKNDAEERISIDNKEFNDFVNLIINPTNEEEIVKAEWIEENACFRVSIERSNQAEEYYAHHDDYIFVKDGTIKWFKVDYPNHKDLQYPDRHVWSACDFSVRYEDVTFDGNKDILIFLGHAGSHGSEVFCAYIYSSGNFVYTKSFENIPNYSIDYDNKIIRGQNTDSASTYHISEYKFADGEFVVNETKYYEYNPESGEYELIRVE